MKYGSNFIFLLDGYLVVPPPFIDFIISPLMWNSTFIIFRIFVWYERRLFFLIWMERSSSVIFNYPRVFVYLFLILKCVHNHQYHIQRFLFSLREFITKFISVSLSVLHTTFKYYEHFSLPAVTTPSYICYISLNHLAVLFAAPLYNWCLHLTRCSEIAVIILGESSKWKPISTIQFTPQMGINFQATALICWLFKQSTLGEGGKRPTKCQLLLWEFFCYLYQQKMIQTLKEKGHSVLGFEPKKLHRYSSKIHYSLHLNRCSFKRFMTLLNSLHLKGGRGRCQI